MFRLFPTESLVQTADETFVGKRIRLGDCQTSTYEMLPARRSDTADALGLYLRTQAILLSLTAALPICDVPHSPCCRRLPLGNL